MAEGLKILDYDGLKTLVSCIISEMPVFDNKTIVKNIDGEYSVKTIYEQPEISEDGSIVFSASSPVEVSGETLIFT